MQQFLNLTLPLKQDPESLAGLQQLLANLDPNTVTTALAGSEIVHFARFLLIGTQYIQIITTYDGTEEFYADFFWKQLNNVFKNAYEFVEGAPTGDDWTEDNFLAFNKIPAHQPVPFYLFSAYPDKTVKIINAAA